jgi:predicted RNase H-like nuclease (RuvC/YqgF family)
VDDERIPHAWSVVSLREYFEALLAERTKTLEGRFTEYERALVLRERELDRRLEELNNLRREYTSDRGKLVSVEKYEAEVPALQREQIEARSRYVTVDRYTAEIEPLQDLRGKVVAIIAGSVALATVLGAVLGRLFGG